MKMEKAWIEGAKGQHSADFTRGKCKKVLLPPRPARGEVKEKRTPEVVLSSGEDGGSYGVRRRRSGIGQRGRWANAVTEGGRAGAARGAQLLRAR